MRKLVFGLFLNSYIVNMIKNNRIINAKIKLPELYILPPKRGFSNVVVQIYL